MVPHHSPSREPTYADALRAVLSGNGAVSETFHLEPTTTSQCQSRWTGIGGRSAIILWRPSQLAIILRRQSQPDPKEFTTHLEACVTHVLGSTSAVISNRNRVLYPLPTLKCQEIGHAKGHASSASSLLHDAMRTETSETLSMHPDIGGQTCRVTTQRFVAHSESGTIRCSSPTSLGET